MNTTSTTSATATLLYRAALIAAVLSVGVGGCSSQAGGPTPAPSPTPATCPDPHGGACLGALDAGTYTTSVFDPAITYEVPDGWFNSEDLPGNFGLHRDVDDQSGVQGGSYIGIYQDARAAAQSCAETPEPGVGTSAEEMMAWITSLPGVTASEPEAVNIGGLDGLSTDLAPGDELPCTFDGHSGTPIIIGSGVSSLHHTLLEGMAMRLIVLDWADKNVTIEITSIDEDIPAADYRALVAPIVESIQFHE